VPDTHVIRLRGPWEFEPLCRVSISHDGARSESKAHLPPVGRVHLPADWGLSLGADFRGRVRYTRRFGLPTNLEPHERVWLVCDGVDYFGELAVNDQFLGRIEGYERPAEFEIGTLLAERNLLELIVELPQYKSAAAAPSRPGRAELPGGPIGEVRLEIRS
jgi:beta-mannosidase